MQILIRVRTPALVVAAVILLAPLTPSAQAPAGSAAWTDAYREPAARLVGEAMSNQFAWERLAELGDTFGHRLSGSNSSTPATGS